MVMKPEVKDRILSHEHPVTAAIYNRKFSQVKHTEKVSCASVLEYLFF